MAVINQVGNSLTGATGTGQFVGDTDATLVAPDLGTPVDGTLTNCDGLPLTTGVTGTLPVANGGTGVTSSTGTTNVVLSNSPTLVTPNIGTPSAGVLTNTTGLPLTTGVTGVLPVANGGTGVTSSTGTGNTVLSNTPTLVAPEIGAATGTSLNLGASTTIDGFLDEDNMASNSATKGATQQSIKAYVDTVAGGLVDSVTGTVNEIDVDNTDPANPVLSLSATLDVPGTLQIQASAVALDDIIDDDTMATATDSNIATAESIKNYVDAQVVAAGSGGLKSVQVFDASGTWTKPAGIDQIVVECIGAGGGGAGCNSATSQVATGGGGGAGGYGYSLIDVSAISSETVTIGAGGTGGAAGSNIGANGGASSFGVHINCTGGFGGQTAPASLNDRVASGGAGGVASSADINVNGSYGFDGVAPLGGVIGGHGANSKFGAGGQGFAINGAGGGDGGAALGNGAGGGGATTTNTTTDRAGGAGAAGICIVWEYTVGATIPVGNVAPVGAIMSFARTTPPVGFLECDGSAISRTTYSELFTAIGTTWGVGDGSTTFNIPNLPRRTLVGSGGSPSAELGNAVGNTGGAETSTLTTGNMPAGTPITSGTSGGINVVSNTGTASYVPRNTSPYSGGSATPVDIIQPSAVVLMCIAYQANVVADATAASQAEMEAATSNTVFSTPGRQQLHPGHPKAWVQYNQVANTIGSSYNVTSVTDSSAGNFTVNWSIDFSSINYTVVASTDTAGGGNNLIGIGQNGAKTVGTTLFTTMQVTSTLDRAYNNIVAFGDQ